MPAGVVTREEAVQYHFGQSQQPSLDSLRFQDWVKRAEAQYLRALEAQQAAIVQRAITSATTPAARDADATHALPSEPVRRAIAEALISRNIQLRRALEEIEAHVGLYKTSSATIHETLDAVQALLDAALDPALGPRLTQDGG